MTHPKPNPAPVVTRAHRGLAIQVLGYYPTPTAPYWVETGLGSFASDSYDAADRIAQAIAEAEARGREAGEERLRRVREMPGRPMVVDILKAQLAWDGRFVGLSDDYRDALAAVLELLGEP